jgi:predicted flap endonuclease-1-like 5' DNA nuclease
MNLLPIAAVAACVLVGAWVLGLCSSRKPAAAAAKTAAPAAPARAPVRAAAAAAAAAAPTADAAPGGFDVSKSRISDEVRAKFVSEECSFWDVDLVPGVGPATAAVLKRRGIHTVANLVGQFLRLKEPGISPQQHCDAFAQWLRDSGVTANRNTITLVVADKVGSLMPRLGYNVDNLRF